MKHIFCISLLLLSVSCVFAQKIYVDRIETDGRRQVMATTKEYSVDDKDFKFCLKVFDGSDRRDWLLLVSSYAPMSMESVVLLKLWNEAILRLNVNNVNIGTLENGEIDFIATRFNEKIYIQVTYILSDETVIDREFNAYKKIEDNYPKYVLSMDKFDLSQNGIIHKNIIDWLLKR